MNAAEISRLLAKDIYALVRKLLPNGRKVGSEWVCGSPAGEEGNSCKVHLTGEKAGVWADFATDQKGDALDLVKAVNRCDTRAALAWAHSWLGVADGAPGNGGGTIVYGYVDEAGALRYEVCKKEQPKRFWLRQPDGQGGYKRGENGKLTMEGVRYVPYHLDRLVAARRNANGHPPRVYVCEGEKDADNLATGDLLTTTNPGGASLSRKSKWREDYNQFFAGFDVVILPDNDEAGRVHAQHVAANLAPVAHAVRIVELPGLAKKGDVTDWIHAGGTPDALNALVEQTPLWVPPPPPPPKETSRQEAELGRLNDRYFVVSEAGKVWVGEWRADYTFETRREVLDRFTFADFRKLYLNRSIDIPKGDGESKRMNLAEWWLRHPKRRQYDGVVFAPSGGAPEGCLNLWRGFAVEEAPGDWSLMRHHILQVICRDDQVRNDYFLNWMARMVQHPEEPGEVALVVRSDEEGTGKGILGRYLCRIFGQHALHIVHVPHLTGRFNAHLQDCVFLFADEAFFAGDKQHEGVLKGLITEYELTIEGKYRAVVSVRNRLHILIVSNRDWVVPMSITARRFFITEALDTYRGNRSYFANIVKQMDNGGVAAMLHELRTRDISNFDVRAIPETEEAREQKALSLPSLDRWWLSVLSRGYLWRSRHGAPWFIEWHEFYTTELLMNSYLQWCNANRPPDRKNQTQLGLFFTDIYQPSRPRGAHPVHEVESIERGRTRVTAIGIGGDQQFISESVPLDELAIVMKDHPHGYQVGELEAACTMYADKRKGIDPPWNVPPERDPGPGA